MRLRSLALAMLQFCLLPALSSSSASAQVSPERLATLRSRVVQLKASLDRISPRQRRMLSSGALNLMQLAQNWDKFESVLARSSGVASRRPSRRAAAASPFGTAIFKATPVSNPKTDFLYSVLAGFTQSETSTAWCGSNAVVGFNDSGSVFESLLTGPGGLSFTGAASSTDQGASFHDAGFINPGAGSLNLLAGDPVVNCASPNTFYFSQIFASGTTSAPLSAVAVSRSSNVGASWEDPVAAVSKDGLTHMLDKDWMTLDPTDNKRIYVTYTDFDSTGDLCGVDSSGAPNTRIAVELVTSDDEGHTWTSPVVINEVCSIAPDFPVVQGSQVLIGQLGEVYVAWESLTGPTSSTREIDLRKSTDHGTSFGPVTKVTDVTPVGDGFVLQGGFRNNEYPMLAIDRSGSASSGTLYVAWNDGRNLQLPDLESSTGLYSYGDILITRSSDGGATWSAPVRVNDNPKSLRTGPATDQFMPGIAVDKTGTVAACWYDRRDDELNFKINRYCGVSTDGGSTFRNARLSAPSWQPWHATDLFLLPDYMGDYDAVTTDATANNAGFLGAFQIMAQEGSGSPTPAFVPNPDVFAVHLP